MAVTKNVNRKPGRPRKGDTNAVSLTRDDIIEKAFELSRTTELGSISFVTMGKALGVSTTAIRYHISSRALFLSLVINRFYRSVCNRLPEPTGNWEEDLRAATPPVLAAFLERKGVTTHLEKSKEFRILQSEEIDEDDYGVCYFEYMIGIFRSAGMPSASTAMAYHMYATLLVSSAVYQIRRILPVETSIYYTAAKERLERQGFANTVFVSPGLSRIDLHTAINASVELVITAIKQGTFERMSEEI